MSAGDQPISQPLANHPVPLCQLSDYDIYVPGDRVKPHLKCPQRFCFGVKSQKGTVMDRDNVVHFFSTSNKQLAHRFHELIVQWRSWHLCSRYSGRARCREATQSVPENLSSLKHRLTATFSNLGDQQPLLDVSQIRTHEPENRYDQSMQQKPGGLCIDAGMIEPIRGETSSVGSRQKKKTNNKDNRRKRSSAYIIKSWFPSALEHTARTRALRGPSRGCAAPQTQARPIGNAQKVATHSRRSGSRRLKAGELPENADHVHFRSSSPRLVRADPCGGQHQRFNVPSRQCESRYRHLSSRQPLDHRIVPPIPRRSSRRMMRSNLAGAPPCAMPSRKGLYKRRSAPRNPHTAIFKIG